MKIWFVAVFLAIEIILYKAPGCRPCQIAEHDLKSWGYAVKTVIDCPKYITRVPAIEWQGKYYQPTDWIKERDSIKKMLP
jgi:hypothetical protein